jgi:hypothetical protein
VLCEAYVGTLTVKLELLAAVEEAAVTKCQVLEVPDLLNLQKLGHDGGKKTMSQTISGLSSQEVDAGTEAVDSWSVRTTSPRRCCTFIMFKGIMAKKLSVELR